MQFQIVKAIYFEVPVRFKMANYIARASRHIVIILKFQNITGFGCSPIYATSGKDLYYQIHSWLIPFLTCSIFSSFKDAKDSLSCQMDTISSSLIHAVDMAIWDIEGKSSSKPLNSILSEQIFRKNIPITEQIFIDNFPNSKKEITRIINRGTKFIKVKIGRNPRQDIDYIRNIARFTKNKVSIKLDANSAYSLEDAIEISILFRDEGIILWEDPLASQSLKEYSLLRQNSELPVMLDANIHSLKDLQTGINQKSLDILNIKLNRVGGITNALKLINLCENNNILISIGCAEDLGPGMSAICQLSSIIKNLSGTEGVGHERLGFDITNPNINNISEGYISCIGTPGLGCSFNEKKLKCNSNFFSFRVYDFTALHKWVIPSLECSRIKSRIKNIPDRINRFLF